MVKFVKFFFDDEQEIYNIGVIGSDHVCFRAFGF